MKKIVLLMFVSLLFIGCSSKYSVSLVDFNSSDILEGVYNEKDSSVVVVMPDGEILRGNYSNLENQQPLYMSNTVGYSSSRVGSGGFGGIGFGIDFNQQSTNYALLKSETSELKMEIFLTKKSWSKNGFGEAKTNDGRVYKIQF